MVHLQRMNAATRALLFTQKEKCSVFLISSENKKLMNVIMFVHGFFRFLIDFEGFLGTRELLSCT